MRRLLAGTAVMLAAVALQLLMVVGVMDPSLALGLGGYAAMLAGAALGAGGVLAMRRARSTADR